MRKTKVRIVGDPELARIVAHIIANNFEIGKRELFDRAVGRDYSHTNAPGVTVYLEILKPEFHVRQLCPDCGRKLEKRKFIETWDSDGKPEIVEECLYCPECRIRWVDEAGPFDFAEFGDCSCCGKKSAVLVDGSICGECSVKRKRNRRRLKAKRGGGNE